MRFFEISLLGGKDAETSLGLVQFPSMEEACADVRAAIPEAAADMIRVGDNPYECSFLVRDDERGARSEVPFRLVLRPVDDGLSRATPA